MRSRERSKNRTQLVFALLAMGLMLAPVSLKAVIGGDTAEFLPEGMVKVPLPEEILFFGADGRVRIIVQLSETPLHLRGYHRYPDKSIPTLALPRLIQAVENLAVPRAQKQPLLNFLRQALDALNRPLQDPAREALFPLKLNLFIKRVEFLAGPPQNLIPPAAAADLIQTAQELILAFASDNELARDTAVIAAEQAAFLEALYLLELQYAQDHGTDPSTVPYPEPTFQFTNLLNAVVVMITPQLFAEVQELPNVVQVEYDRKVEALQNYDWGVERVYGDSVPQVEAGCGPGGYRGKNTTIAIVDTGVQLDHPDLAANIALNDTEISVACGVTVGTFDLDHNGLTIGDLNTAFLAGETCLWDQDGNGQYTIKDLMSITNYSPTSNPCVPDSSNDLWNCVNEDGNSVGGKAMVDDLAGWNFAGEAPGYDANDKHFHGTHVAGIAAANGAYIGVAPYARILPVRVLNASGSGSSSWIIAGMDYVAGKANGLVMADAMNLSLGYPGGTSTDSAAQAMDNAIIARVIGVVAAGNEGPKYYTLRTPGTSLKAITVGASDLADNVSYWPSSGKGSSRGPVLPENDMKPDLLAPGTGICAARWEYSLHTSFCDGNTAQHIALNGTSMAAPHVAGAAAVLVSRFKAEGTAWTPQKVKDILKQSSVDITQTSYISPFDQGAGRLDIPAACSLTTLVMPMHLNFGLADLSADWVSEVKTFTITNLTGTPQTYSWAVDPSFPEHWPSGITVTVNPPQATLAHGDSLTFEVQLTVLNSVTVSSFPTHTYETRIVLSRQASGEPDPTEVARPWILFTKGCKLAVEVKDFAWFEYYMFTNSKELYVVYSLPNFYSLVNCNERVHISLFGETAFFSNLGLWMAEENIDPYSQRLVQFFPSKAILNFDLEPRDKDNIILPSIHPAENRYAGELGLIREPAGGQSFGLAVSPAFAYNRTSPLSPNYHLDWKIISSNGREFYSPSGRKIGMDSDFLYTTDRSDYAAPWFQLPPSCQAGLYRVKAHLNWNYLSYHYDSASNNWYLDYLELPAGSISRLYWFIPTLTNLKSAHNLSFFSKDDPDPMIYWSRSLNSLAAGSPLYSYRLAWGLGLPYVQPLAVLDSETISLAVGPYIWYGVIYADAFSQGYGPVNINWDPMIIRNPIPFSPMFATQEGDFFDNQVNIVLTESDNVTTRNLSSSNILTPRIYAENVPFGRTRIEAASPAYGIAGLDGSGLLLAEFTLDDAIPDNSPPFIRRFEMTRDGQAEPILQAGKLNRILFNLGDKTTGSSGLPGEISTVQLLFQRHGASDDWVPLPLIQDGNTFSVQINSTVLGGATVLGNDNHVWINLKLVAVDNYGNSLTYTMAPAFMFNPWEDSDGDGVEDIHEDNDANDTYTNKPTSDRDKKEPHGLPGKCPGACYFADADGNGMIDLNDLKAVSDYLDGHPWTYDNINPPSPDVQDLDGDTILGSTDKSLYNLILNNRLVSLPGAPTHIDVVSPVDEAPQVSVGDTVPIEVEVLSDIGAGRAGLGVAFEVKQGQATLLGGDGPADACSPGARYDISGRSLDYGRARMVVRVDHEGPIEVDVYVPSDAVLKFELVQIPTPVKITGVP